VFGESEMRLCPRKNGSRAERAAEKGPISELIRSRLLQGQKPNFDLIGLIGPTQVVPLLQNLLHF
jgi:hypothetical protein